MSNPNESVANEDNEAQVCFPMWLFGFAGMALLWNLVGLAVFIAQVSLDPAQMIAVPADAGAEQLAAAQTEIEMYKATPGWVLVAFGVATIGGTLGCLALLLRSKYAGILFALSLLGILVQQAYIFFGSKLMSLPNATVMMPLTILGIAVLLLGVSYYAQRKAWLK